MILQTSPALREGTFLIEQKKIINVGDVHHEIDVFVTINVASGYTPVFIFECKNLRDPVDKNAIIVFSEKIGCANAQRGYFVAKTFTADAQAQALKDARMELITVTENDPRLTSALPDLFVRLPRMTRIDGRFTRRGSDGMNPQELDVFDAEAIYRGDGAGLRGLIEEWAKEIGAEKIIALQALPLPEGVYPHAASGTRDFTAGELVVNGKDMERVALNIKFELLIQRARIVSHFDVQTRGRFISFEATTDWGISVAGQVTMIATSR